MQDGGCDPGVKSLPGRERAHPGACVAKWPCATLIRGRGLYAWTLNNHPTGPCMDTFEAIHKEKKPLSAPELVVMVHMESKSTLGFGAATDLLKFP